MLGQYILRALINSGQVNLKGVLPWWFIENYIYFYNILLSYLINIKAVIILLITK